MENAQQIAGVVLAGGGSSRMGQDKAHLRPLAPFGAGGRDLLAQTHATLALVTPVVWVSCRRGAPRPGYDCVEDSFPGLGPIGGLHAALARARREGCAALLAVPCDLPLLDAPTLRRLLDVRNSPAPAGSAAPLMTTYRQAETGYIEALVAIYEVAALPLLESACREGRRQLNLVVPAERRRDIVYDRAHARPFHNCNTPADLAALAELLG